MQNAETGIYTGSEWKINNISASAMYWRRVEPVMIFCGQCLIGIFKDIISKWKPVEIIVVFVIFA